MGYPAIQMAVDLDRISALLKEHLRGKKKLFAYTSGWAAQNPFRLPKIAREFQVSRQMISGIVGKAQTKLAPVGLTPSLLREAARLQASWHHSCEATKRRSV